MAMLISLIFMHGRSGLTAKGVEGAAHELSNLNDYCDQEVRPYVSKNLNISATPLTHL